jgi:ABC-type transport system substrate-binding protein
LTTTTTRPRDQGRHLQDHPGRQRRFHGLQNGEIDLTSTPPAADHDRIEAAENLKWDGATGYNNSWIFFNYGYPNSPFTDKNVRLAVAYAIDKDAGCKAATDGLGTPATDCVYGVWQGFTHPGYRAPQNDLAKAKELMAASAYPDGLTSRS